MTSTNDDNPIGEPWEQAIAMVLVAVVVCLSHEDHPGTSRHQLQAQKLQEIAKTVLREFPWDSPYSMEVQDHVVNILGASLGFQNRLNPES